MKLLTAQPTRRALLLSAGLGLVMSLTAGAVGPAQASEVPEITWTDAGTHEWVVPQGVGTIRLDAVGGNGGTTCVPGGGGSRVVATLAVTPGETLFITVGGNGEVSKVDGIIARGGSSWQGFTGGSAIFASGERGAAGGGATIIRSDRNLEKPILVAAGGGGAGQCHETKGGNGGSNGDGFRSGAHFIRGSAAGGVKGGSGSTTGHDSTGRGGAGGGGWSGVGTIGGGGPGGTVHAVGGGGGGSGASYVDRNALKLPHVHETVSGTHSAESSAKVTLTYSE